MTDRVEIEPSEASQEGPLEALLRADQEEGLEVLEEEPELLEAAPVGLHDPVESFLARSGTPKTRSTMSQALRRAQSVAGLPDGFSEWWRMDFAQTDAVRSALLARYPRSTVQLSLVALRGVFRQARKMGLITHVEELAAVDWEKLRKHDMPLAGREVSMAERERVTEWSETLGGDYGRLVRGVLQTLFGCGLRAQEVSWLLVESCVDATEKMPKHFAVLGKGQKVRKLTLVPAILRRVEDWLSIRQFMTSDPAWLFLRVPQNARTIQRAGLALTVKWTEYLCATASKLAGVEPFTPHDCRRTFGTSLLRDGVGLEVVQRLMGHEDPKTTERYDMRQEEEDASMLLQHAASLVPSPRAAAT